MLGEHGYVGLILFLLLWLLVWRDAVWIMRRTQNREDLRWASRLAQLIQVSLVGYAVGGTFLNLAYYDVPYNLLVALVLTRLLVAKAIEEVDSAQPVRAVRTDEIADGMPRLKPTQSVTADGSARCGADS
jgi:hypothetical protein